MRHPKRLRILRFQRRTTLLCCTLLLSALYLFDTYQPFMAQSEQGTIPAQLPHTVFLPVIQLPPDPPPDPSPAPTQEPLADSDLDWDARLDQRGAILVRATVAPGQGYWRLVKGVWYNHLESEGRHHILIDMLDAASNRQSDVAVQIAWHDDAATVYTEPKPGEEYATNYPMYALAPAYAVFPAVDAPADRVEGLGLGEIDEPYLAFHTSYGLVWRWSIAALPATPVPTASPTASATPTPSATTTPTPATVATGTPSATATPSPFPPTSTPTPTAPATAVPQPFTASVTGCVADEQGSRFEGYVYQQDQPLNGARIVFSYEADGRWATQPTETGRGVPGFYAHIISAGVARAGDWFAWMVDGSGARISTLAAFHTGGPGGGCNVFTINFRAE